ncbi:lecithin retinol acyltransferase family protein [Synechococcus sp. YX-04-1]|uniref:lecithin retinol acyltransferase family protein n=1 Tax=unclassified Synechococcus TaxID=2626047 RepID=UPI001CF83B46|nr:MULTISPECIES: lecithin retinol acyltransferase family protein [unclassified Synechococcus]MCB4389357.1 lecithin retinol acyltransferase family protein [Synechococcus sp. MU1617]MDO6351194.1 lecithin retinol acyltransferase family protein [Synechococcus sp. YX-04-1]
MAAADHLEVPRQHGLFNHHGIDLGDGTVAHYLEGREILRSPLEEFSQGQPLRVISHAEASPVGVTLRRAMGRLGEQDYNLLFNNCEHFATWCKTGRHRSEQVDSFLDRARNWSGLMPSALIKGLELLVQRGLLDDDARTMAKRGVEKLERLRLSLLHKLEGLLERAGDGTDRSLLLTGQSLADELAAVEDLKQRIDSLLEQRPALPGSESSE